MDNRAGALSCESAGEIGPVSALQMMGSSVSEPEIVLFSINLKPNP